MATFTALTTVLGKINATDLGNALERLSPEPIGVGVFELGPSGRPINSNAMCQVIEIEIGLCLFFQRHRARRSARTILQHFSRRRPGGYTVGSSFREKPDLGTYKNNLRRSVAPNFQRNNEVA